MIIISLHIKLHMFYQNYQQDKRLYLHLDNLLYKFY
jgi:hypothetical protein